MKLKLMSVLVWVTSLQVGLVAQKTALEMTTIEPRKDTFTCIGKPYSNPVVASSMPDPTVIYAKGCYYLYATEDVRNMPILTSHDLVHWKQIGTVFTEETRPTFEPQGGLWAPDINCIDGKYVLYYAMSVWGGEQTCGIGVATADQPEGPFTDHGKLFRSNEIGVTNSIDPCFMEEAGKKYLFWGSFRGIYAIELSHDGLTVKEGAQKIPVAGTRFEATDIEKHNGFYYLFASVGTCCEGIKSTYKTVVGRSKFLLGPYVDKSGKSMLNNGCEIVIDKNARFVGNGHNARLVKDAKGNNWILYHGVDLKHPKGRVLLLDPLFWDQDGWPYIIGGSPSTH